MNNHTAISKWQFTCSRSHGTYRSKTRH